MSEQPSPQAGVESGIVLAGRYAVHADQPLAKLDSPLAPAVAATDLRADGRSLFALICRPDLLPRIDVIPTLKRLNRFAILNPVDAGAAPWPGAGGRRFVIIFEHQTGERVLTSPDARCTPMREDAIVDTVIKPLVPVLGEFASRTLRHRAIRADNLFYADATRQSVLLGECVSAPPGLSQPVFYEPIDAAMARPSGRGPGLLADDLYALGVLLVVLLAGGNPVAGRPDEEIIEKKICEGSYAALVGDLRISLKLMEPLRGLLCDDPKERWTANELTMWLSGRHLSPKQAVLPAKAARSIAFAGKDYWNRPALAHQMARNWSESVKLVASGLLGNWLRRSMSDEESAAALSEAAGFAADTPGDADNLVSRALMVVDPRLPLRFKNFSARLDGVMQTLAIEFNNPDVRNTFIQIMRAKLPQILLQSQLSSRPEHASLMKTFDRVNTYLDRQQLGTGVERALYECNRGWPCQSPLIRDEYVCELEDLLPALEHVARRGASTGEPVDPHIVAFCAAQNKSMVDRVVRNLNARDDLPMFRLGVLQLLGDVQRYSGPEARYPALSRWLAGLIKPVVDTFHNRATRAKLALDVEHAGDSGNLLELLSLVDNAETRKADSAGFRVATKEFADLTVGLTWLEAGGLISDRHVRVRSQQAATLISAMVAGVMIVLVGVIYLI